MVKFRDQLRNYLKNKIPDDLIPLLPSGFQAIEFVVILNLKEELYPFKEIIGSAVVELLPYVRSVWLRKGKIEGKFRKPGGLEFICGDPETEVEHHENNIRYRFNFTQIMFAKGNVTERKYLPQLVNSGEIIVDMFAGIGYFSLGIAKFADPEKIYSIELNPVSFTYLKKNIEINKLSEKIVPINGDSAIEVPKLAQTGVLADRIIMGVFPAPFEFISSLKSIIKPIPLFTKSNLEEFVSITKTPSSKADIYDKLDKPIENTVIHFEGVSMGKNIEELFNKFSELMKSEGYNSSLLAFRFVKSFGPKMWHLVLDIAVGL
ncbi:MAG: hypothetical protein GY870_05215 [archaeon]|nr:hypothetical protein [archaeon]